MRLKKKKKNNPNSKPLKIDLLEKLAIPFRTELNNRFDSVKDE